MTLAELAERLHELGAAMLSVTPLNKGRWQANLRSKDSGGWLCADADTIEAAVLEVLSLAAGNPATPPDTAAEAADVDIFA